MAIGKAMPQLRRATRLKIVQAVTLARIGGAALFASVALSSEYRRLAIVFYACALSTDLLDGWLARNLNAVTKLGAAFDGVADKYLTVASVLFFAALDFSLLACCLALLRDIVVQGLRVVMASADGLYLFPPNRRLGGLLSLPARIITAFILLQGDQVEKYRQAVEIGIWLAAIISLVSLACSIYQERAKLVLCLYGNT